MASRSMRPLPLAVAWQAGVWWSVNLCFFQQTAALAGLRHYRVESMDYWARNGRLSLIVLGAAAFVWACRGSWRFVTMAVLGMVGWVAADVALDRAKVAGALACVTLAVAACVVLTGLWWLAGRAGQGARHSHRGVLVVTAAIAASASVGNYAYAESAFPGALFNSLVISGLAVAITLGCAVIASATPKSPRPVAALGVLTVVVAWFGSWMKSAAPQYDAGLLGIWEYIVLALLFGGVAVLSGAARRVSGYLVSAAIVLCGSVVVPWVCAYGLFFLAEDVLPPSVRDFLTTAAGHPPVYTDYFDTDLPWVWVALLNGLIVGLPLAAVRAHQPPRPALAEASSTQN